MLCLVNTVPLNYKTNIDTCSVSKIEISNLCQPTRFNGQDVTHAADNAFDGVEPAIDATIALGDRKYQVVRKVLR